MVSPPLTSGVWDRRPLRFLPTGTFVITLKVQFRKLVLDTASALGAICSIRANGSTGPILHKAHWISAQPSRQISRCIFKQQLLGWAAFLHFGFPCASDTSVSIPERHGNGLLHFTCRGLSAPRQRTRI